MRLGVNADPKHKPATATIAQLGGLCRFPLRRTEDRRPFVRALQRRGVEPVLILTNEWFSAEEQENWDWEAGAREARRKYPTVTIWQAGNEPDIEGPSSETRPPEETSALIAGCRAGLGPDAILWGPGSGSGDLWEPYWPQVDLEPLNAFAQHIYAQVSPRVSSALLRARMLYKLPVVVTEIGLEQGAYDSEHERAQDVSEYLVMMSEIGVEAALWYALQDKQCGGLALLKGKQPTESFAAWADAGG